MKISKAFRFEAAHRLPNTPENHKCRRLHGHSYRVAVRVGGPVDPTMGWVIDFSEIAKAWEPLHDLLDHHYLNEVPGLENPTSENLAKWIWERLIGDLPTLERITVRETCTSACYYEGPDHG